MTRSEILALLKMSEDEQEYLLWQNKFLKSKGIKDDMHGVAYEDYESLADLAFRLRGEYRSQISEVQFFDSCKEIYRIEWNFEKPDKSGIVEMRYREWFLCYAQPIHWIVAALLAGKE